MICPEALSHVSDHLKGGDLPQEVRQHIQECPACQREYQDLGELWKGLASLSQPVLSSALRGRVLAARTKRWNHPWLAAAALVLGLVGGGTALGLALRTRASDTMDPMTRLAAAQSRNTLRLVHSASPADRLKGLALMGGQEGAMAGTLFDLVDRDPDTQVRLAAVESLYLFADAEDLHSNLVRRIAQQDRPEVQMALIDLVVGLREKRAVAALRRLNQEGKVSPELKERIEAGLSRLEPSPM